MAALRFEDEDAGPPDLDDFGNEGSGFNNHPLASPFASSSTANNHNSNPQNHHQTPAPGLGNPNNNHLRAETHPPASELTSPHVNPHHSTGIGAGASTVKQEEPENGSSVDFAALSPYPTNPNLLVKQEVARQRLRLADLQTPGPLSIDPQTPQRAETVFSTGFQPEGSFPPEMGGTGEDNIQGIHQTEEAIQAVQQTEAEDILSIYQLAADDDI